jgi:hypothetical protein
MTLLFFRVESSRLMLMSAQCIMSSAMRPQPECIYRAKLCEGYVSAGQRTILAKVSVMLGKLKF